jgi:DNA polymerase-3 subunit epsilon
MFMHLSLRLRIFLLFALMAIGGALLVAGGLVLGYIRLGEEHALSSFVIAGVVVVLAIFGLTTWIWVMFDEHVARPVERLAAEMRTRAHTDVTHDIDLAPARYLGDLAPAAQAVATNLTETRNAMAMAVGRETARLGLEKSRLETLLAEVPDGVLFCTPQHKVALYNAHAKAVLGDTGTLGLNRAVADLLLPGPIHDAYDRLRKGNAENGADILCATRAGARLLEARMRLLWLEGQETDAPGYVLMLRDVTEALRVQADRAHLFNTLLEGVAQAAHDTPALADLVRDISTRKAVTDTEWWPMEALAATDLGASLAVRLKRKDVVLAVDLPQVTLRCDGFAITRMLERLALSWGADEMALRMAGDGVLSLESAGGLPDAGRLTGWLATPLSPGLSGFSGRDVLICHGSTLTATALPDGRAALRLTLALAGQKPAQATPAILYDFDLLQTEVPRELSQARLRKLSFVIFDTETTGLNPQVDEVCQIAAVRVVNGKTIAAERFNILVNPGRRIPPSSTEVHHITDAMVTDAPDVTTALRQFHRFAQGCVLVAHNAPFDMAFLRRREAELGLRFDQPILDTVLCSAILYGQSAEHTLDALCLRLGVSIPEADRHSAIGDAIGTAEAFRKMIPMLEAADLPDLGTLITAFDRHARLIGHLN